MKESIKSVAIADDREEVEIELEYDIDAAIITLYVDGKEIFYGGSDLILEFLKHAVERWGKNGRKSDR